MPVAALTRTLLAAFAAVALLAGASTPGANARSAATGGPTLWVWASGGHFAQDSPELGLEYDFGAAGTIPARISTYVPAGFELYPVRPAGSDVGLARVFAADYSRGSVTLTLLTGEVTAVELDAADEQAAQACSPGPHVAHWVIGLSLLGRTVDIPIYVAETGASDPAGLGLRLDICAPPVAADGALLPISQLILSLPELDAPSARGSYLWRAVVTPLAPDRRTALPGNAFELRAAVLVPHRLTLTGKYFAKTHSVLLHGTLRALGQPRRGVPVTLIKLIRRVTPGGAIFRDVVAARGTTKANGTYAFRVALRKSAGFIAVASDTERACTGAALAPQGCLSMTTAGTESDPITISAGRP